MIYSHFLDFIGKVFSLVTTSILIINYQIFKKINPYLSQTSNPDFFQFLVLGVIYILVYFSFHRPIVDVLVTKIYVSLKFKVKVKWHEARKLRKLFCLNKNFKWYPMKEVKDLSVEKRLDVLLRAADEIH